MGVLDDILHEPGMEQGPKETWIKPMEFAVGTFDPTSEHEQGPFVRPLSNGDLKDFFVQVEPEAQAFSVMISKGGVSITGAFPGGRKRVLFTDSIEWVRHPKGYFFGGVRIPVSADEHYVWHIRIQEAYQTYSIGYEYYPSETANSNEFSISTPAGTAKSDTALRLATLKDANTPSD